MRASSRFGLVLALAALTAPSLAQSPPPALSTYTVEPSASVGGQVWDGVIEAVQHTTLTAQTSARVLELPFDVGDAFKQGAVLAKLSDTEQQAGLRSAQAHLSSAQAEAREAALHWTRTAELFKQHANSQAQLDAATARRDTSRAALGAAQAAVDSARQQLRYTTIEAPFDGIVLRRLAQPGQAVQSGPPEPQPLLAIANLHALRVDVVIPQSAAAALRPQAGATITLGDHQVITSRQITLFPYADPASHTRHVRVRLPDGTDLRPGMTIQVEFPSADTTVLRVPASAVIHRGELTALYVLGPDSTPTLRQVRLGRQDGEQIEILAGLRAGETIATDPTAAAQALIRQRDTAGARP